MQRPNGKLTAAFLAAAMSVGSWWVGRVMGATDRVIVLETKVAVVEQQLDRMESKLDRLLGARNGSKGVDGLRGVPGTLPEGSVGPVR